MDGFEGIIGVGQGGKKGNFLQNPKSAIFGKKRPVESQEARRCRPSSPGILTAAKSTSGEERKWPTLKLGHFREWDSKALSCVIAKVPPH